MSDDPDRAGAWMRQWMAAGPALAAVRRREMGRLTDEEALRISELVLSAAAPGAVGRRPEDSGLVVQQALFHRRIGR